MKFSLTVLLITLFSLSKRNMKVITYNSLRFLFPLCYILLITSSLFSQNPIVREEYFEQDINQWNKVSIVERAFDNQGILTNEKWLYFDNLLVKWIPQTESWFDQAGNVIRIRRQFFISINSGFFIEETQNTYNESNQLLVRENYIRENKDSELVLNERTETTYFEDCSYLQESYFRNGTNDEPLLFSNMVLFVFDKDCELIESVYSDRENTPLEQLRNQIRITYTSLGNGQEQRLVERMTCPQTFGCDDFRFVKQETFNADGQLIYSVNGSTTDFFRRITTIAYQDNQTVYTYENLQRTNNLPNQTLLSRDITTIDTTGNVLSRKRFEPFSFDETRNIYDAEGQIMQTIYDRTTKDSTGLTSFSDTTNYSYQYYCDDLVAERIEDFGNFKNKVTFNYLNPAECGTVANISNITIFPNPAINTLIVANPNFTSSTYELEIYNSLGQFIRTVTNYRGGTQNIDISDLPNGVYHLSIPQTEKRITQTFVIQR